MPDISPHSIVEPGAKLARDVTVGPFCYIGPNVKLGAGCVIENNVTIVGNTTLGPGCHVFPMAVIGETQISSDDTPADGKCIVGGANAIREHVTIYAGPLKTPTRIGKSNLIMIASQVGPGAQIGDQGIFANCTHIAANAVIEDYVRTSAFSFVDKGITVGAYTFTAGYVHVDHDAPPYAMIQGSPYRIRGTNTHNLKSCGFGEDDIRALKRAFRDLYNHTGTIQRDVLQSLASDRKANRYVKKLIKAIQSRRDARAIEARGVRS